MIIIDWGNKMLYQPIYAWVWEGGNVFTVRHHLCAVVYVMPALNGTVKLNEC